jgi:hypothetical protein
MTPEKPDPLRPEVRRAMEESWKQDEAAYRYLAEVEPELPVQPVRIDADGHLLTPEGEPIVRPTLPPDGVLKGIADVEAGRVRPLGDILAMTPEEREAQRVSFAYGQLAFGDPTVTKEDVERAAEKMRRDADARDTKGGQG